MNNPEARERPEQDTKPFADSLEYHKETKELCPKCGAKLLADNLGGLFLKCSKCSWKGDLSLLSFLEKAEILKRLFLDEEYRQRFDQAKTRAEINSVLMDFQMNEQRAKRRNKSLSHENKSTGTEPSGIQLAAKFLTSLMEDSERGYDPLIVRNIPTQVTEEFEKKIMTNPKHHGETAKQALNKEILNFMLRTIERKDKKE